MTEGSGKPESRKATNASIRRTVIWRLGLVGFAVGLIGIGIVIVMERGRISDRVLERATSDARALEILTAGELEGTPQQARKAMEVALERFMAHDRPDRLGQFEYVDFRSPSGEVFTSRYARDGGRAGELSETVHGLDRLLGHDWNGARYGITRLGDERYVAVQVPLRNSKDKVVAYSQGLFHVSRESMGDSWRKARRMILILLLTIASVVAVLYPVISSLMRRLGYAAVDLRDANLGTLEVLGSAIAKRDSDTDAHNYRVTIYATRLAEALGLPPKGIRSLIKGALMHDVGKIGIPDHVLLKPGRLTPEEFEAMKRHVMYGLDIVSHDAWLRDAAEVVGFHHEKYDGSGYYAGRRAAEIPLGARIFAVVDVFDALTSRRPYKEPLSYEETASILLKARESHFDPDVLNAFLRIAPDLYQKMVCSGEKDARRDLQEIVRHYFRGDIDEIMGIKRSLPERIHS